MSANRFIALITALAVCLANGTRAENKIGLILPLSGGTASYGVTTLGAFELAQPSSYVMLKEDDQCDAKRAVTAYRLLQKKGVRIFYVGCSGGVLAIAPLARKDGTLVLTSYGAAAKVRETGKEVIRLIPDAVSVADALAAYVREHFPGRAEKVALVHEEQDYAVSVADTLQKRLDDKVAVRESYPPEITSVKSMLMRLNRPGISAILFAPTNEASARIVLKELGELRVRTPVVGEVNLCDYPFTLSDFGLNGVCYAARFDSPAFHRFLEEYREYNRHEAYTPFYDAITFDLARRLDELGRSIDFNTAAGTAALQRALLEGFDGRFAAYRFDASGKVVGSEKYLVLKVFK